MSTGRIVALGAKLKGEHRILDGQMIAAEWSEGDGEAGNVAWHMVAVEGKWDGHWMGAFSLNRAMFDQMVLGFGASPIDTVVDYEHASVFGDRESPAAGWVKALERRELSDGQQTMWARVAWTSRAADYIRADEYRYLSPTIVFNARDRKSGKIGGARLHSVALTNVPFLHELPEVRLNSLRAAMTQHEEVDPMDREQFEALCKALKLDPTKTTVEQVIEMSAKMLAERDGATTVLAGCREALGVAEDGNVVAAARAARVSATAADPNELAALRVQVQTLAQVNALREAERLVRESQAQGKVQADGTENHKSCLAWAQKDPSGFAAFMATLAPGSVAPVVTGSALTGTGGRGLPIGDDTPEAQEQRELSAKYRKQLGLTEDDAKAAREGGATFHL